MDPSQDKIEVLRNQVREMTEAEGLSFDRLAESAKDIVVFGSRASGVHRASSDLDLLVISDKSGHKKRGKLDLVFVPNGKVGVSDWRRTELARHIAAFGVSLMHERPQFDAICDGYAANRKQLRLHKLVKSLLPCWEILNEELKLKYFTRLRRELQRYRYLKRGQAVPPTAVLDSILVEPHWINLAFREVESDASISSIDAARVYQLMAKEADRIDRLATDSKGRNSGRAA